MHSSSRFIPFVLALGMSIRLFFVISSDFPLNDGGLFYTMTRDLLNAHFLLPDVTSYNHMLIPFAYPPLAFYIVGFIAHFFSLQLITVFRFFPFVVSCFSLVVFYFFASLVLRSQDKALIALFIFSLVPRSYLWLIMGGGVSRSLGLFFALCVLYWGYLFLERFTKQRLVFTVLSLTVVFLSHLEMAVFVLYSLFLIYLFFAKDRKKIYSLFFVVAGAVVMSGPWWVTVLQKHGIMPFLSAFQTGSLRSGLSIFSLFTFQFTEEPLVPLLGILGLFGLFVSMLEKKFFLPVWLLTIFIFSSRSASTLATIPLAFLGAGVVEKVFPYFLKLGRDNKSAFLMRGITLYIAVYFLTSSAMVGFSETTPLGSLSKGDREAMQWISRHTPSFSRFLLITDAFYWEMDRRAEWFPALTGRISVVTPQGSEWLPNREFERRVKNYKKLKQCDTQDIDCFLQWAHDTKNNFSYMYMVKSKKNNSNCCSLLEYSLRRSLQFDRIYENTDVVIFAQKTTHE